MAEQYVRPPLIAREPRSPALALWRFRLVGFLLLALLAAIVVITFLQLTGVTAADPGLDRP